jgi:hypothetical protein
MQPGGHIIGRGAFARAVTAQARGRDVEKRRQVLAAWKNYGTEVLGLEIGTDSSERKLAHC